MSEQEFFEAEGESSSEGQIASSISQPPSPERASPDVQVQATPESFPKSKGGSPSHSVGKGARVSPEKSENTNSDSASVSGSFGDDNRSKFGDGIDGGSLPTTPVAANNADSREVSPEAESPARKSPNGKNNESRDVSPKNGLSPGLLPSNRLSSTSLASTRSMPEEPFPPKSVASDTNLARPDGGEGGIAARDGGKKQLTPPPQFSNVTRHNSDASSIGSSTGKSQRSSDKKRQKWYSSLYPSYKQRNEEFHKLFPTIPESDRLLIDYSCALQRDILVQGRLYVSQNFICFYAKIIAWETVICTPWKSVTALAKERTARIIPNAISYSTDVEQFYFTSFGQRDRTFTNLYRIWQGAVNSQPMSPAEFWSFVHYQYGDDLGLESDDDDYIQPAYLRSFPEVLVSTNGDFDGDSEVPSIREPQNSRRSTPDSSMKADMAGSPASDKSDATDGNTVGVESSDSDRAQDSPEPVFIPPTPVKGQTLIDHNFEIPFERFFLTLFSESELLKEMFVRRKIFEAAFGQWELDPTTDCQIRNVKYSIMVGPKTIRSEERQTLLKESIPGRLHLVDSVAQNHGAPYSDSFSVVTHYCVYKLTNTSTRLRVSSEVVFRKANWAIKAILDKGVMDQLRDYFGDLKNRLVNFEAELATRETEQVVANVTSDGGAVISRQTHRDVLVSTSSMDNRRMTIRRHRSSSTAPEIIELQPVGQTDFVTQTEYSNTKRLLYFIVLLLAINACLYWFSPRDQVKHSDTLKDRMFADVDISKLISRLADATNGSFLRGVNEGLVEILSGLQKINNAVEELHRNLSEAQLTRLLEPDDRPT